ncbi:hypothetical protein [Actinoplanes sp. N902-109]|uniref:hypothetical protein n=1 Tax=Actinoplanes sp. (strain N902-109) TaxID=649831 RepID=UPI0003294597|nr:hypothetical protein [Actinoplanes sp. N902-109]AGL20685.1 hypothetical protein L083_7175 [Actinoplanes sp. N902-109]
MRNRRPLIASLALVTALGLTACGTNDGSSAAGPDRSAGVTGHQVAEQLSPEADLAAAAKKLSGETMKVDMTMGSTMSMSGVADGKTGDVQMTVDMGALGDGNSMEMRKVGTDMYMKLGGELGKTLGGDSSKEWLHIDAAKLGEGSTFNFNSKDDPAGTKALLDAVTQVERVGGDGFKGTIDLTKSPRYNKNKESLKALGAKATTIPFTAKKDSQGRLTELTMDMSSLGAGAAGGTFTTKYHDFGTPVSVEAPPASQVQEMPSQLSGLLNA